MGEVVRFDIPVNREENAVSAFVELQRNFRSTLEISNRKVNGKCLRADRSVLLFFAHKLIYELVEIEDNSGAAQSAGDIVDGLCRLEQHPRCSDLELQTELTSLRYIFEDLKDQLTPLLVRYKGAATAVELGTRLWVGDTDFDSGPVA